MEDEKEDFFDSEVEKYQFSKHESNNKTMIVESIVLAGVVLVLFLLTQFGGR